MTNRTKANLAILVLASAATVIAMTSLPASAASIEERTALEMEVNRSVAKAFATKPRHGQCRKAHAQINPGVIIPNSTLSRVIRRYRAGGRIKVLRKATETWVVWLFKDMKQRICILHEGRGHKHKTLDRT